MAQEHATYERNSNTVGSKMAGEVGAGIYCVYLDLKLPEYCCIFQTNVFLVRKAAGIANNTRNDTNNINVYVDSQALR